MSADERCGPQREAAEDRLARREAEAGEPVRRWIARKEEADPGLEFQHEVMHSLLATTRAGEVCGWGLGRPPAPRCRVESLPPPAGHAGRAGRPRADDGGPTGLRAEAARPTT